MFIPNKNNNINPTEHLKFDYENIDSIGKKSKGNYFDDLHKLIKSGLAGKNEGIPIGLPKLGKYATIRKKMYYLVGGYTGLIRKN